ncbi:OLC1v1015766C1 [Oldenlandia corymbosa var. corymbosa]|uniref:OLC1v1015766C1 n=1 Tax=Oldenlandia corymbosa var. corymbosa TaxID=529605 RepID=A0AAV1E478_OLDCO|nr:OLC1v1015766C1 [Oldenlandia corymbosa var. corymbosa]
MRRFISTRTSIDMNGNEMNNLVLIHSNIVIYDGFLVRIVIIGMMMQSNIEMKTTIVMRIKAIKEACATFKLELMYLFIGPSCFVIKVDDYEYTIL